MRVLGPLRFEVVCVFPMNLYRRLKRNIYIKYMHII